MTQSSGTDTYPSYLSSALLVQRRLYMTDMRNVLDHFRGMSEQEIISQLDASGVKLEVAIENTLRDYNMGTIVRNANAFGVRHVHVIGRKQWNKRGAMAT